jgi:MFS family permease
MLTRSRSHPAKASLRRVVWPLALTEIIVWAAMYYSFPALLLQWERDLGWSKTALSGAFSAALLLSALLAPLAGRLIDRGLGLPVFTGSAILGGLLLALLSRVSALWQFYAVWLGLGIAIAGCHYEATFAILTRTMGDDARRAITRVTLISGFAGTVSFQATEFVATRWGWQGAVLGWGLATLGLGVPLSWAGCRSANQNPANVPVRGRARTGAVDRVLRNPVFWLLALCFALIALDHGMLLNHLLPLLDEQGIGPPMAVLAASMMGPMQVVGRLGVLAVENRVTPARIFAACFVAMGLGALALSQSAVIPLLVAIFLLLHGAGYGVTSIMRPVVTAGFLGRQDFGVIAGMLAIPFRLTIAGAPTIAALIWQVGGYGWVVRLALLAALAGLLALVAAVRVIETAHLAPHTP